MLHLRKLGGICYGLWLMVLGTAVQAEPLQPLGEFPVLFPTVQNARIYPDDKRFTDAVPKHSPEQIRKLFREDLKAFVEEHFELPAKLDNISAIGHNDSLQQHVEWVLQQRRQLPVAADYDTLLPLPHNQAIGADGRREIYYWVSYFTALGLAELGDTQTIRNMLDNFVWQIEQVGFIPQNNRSYNQSHSNPPVFSLMVELLASLEGEQVLLHYLPALEQEYQYWMAGRANHLGINRASQHVVRMPDGTELNRYWTDNSLPSVEHYSDDLALAASTSRNSESLYRGIRASVESGWPLSNRWLSVPNVLVSIDTTKVVPIDLNVLLYHYEQTLARAYSIANNQPVATQYQQVAQRRRAAIQRYLWDEELGLYQDYHYVQGTHTNRLSIATVFPLWMRIADADQAERVVTNIRQRFLRQGGVMASEMDATWAYMWDAPYGWAPMQWATVRALANYQYDQLASQVAQRWININQYTHDQCQCVFSVYDVDQQHSPHGRSTVRANQGWAAGVLLALLQLYPQQQPH